MYTYTYIWKITLNFSFLFNNWAYFLKSCLKFWHTNNYNDIFFGGQKPTTCEVWSIKTIKINPHIFSNKISEYSMVEGRNNFFFFFWFFMFYCAFQIVIWKGFFHKHFEFIFKINTSMFILVSILSSWYKSNLPSSVFKLGV